MAHKMGAPLAVILYILLVMNNAGTSVADNCTNRQTFYVVQTEDNQQTICITNNGSTVPTPRPERTGLDCCFNTSGDFEGCTLTQVKKIGSRYFQRVPESFKKGMSEEEFFETGGLGRAEIKRTRALAFEVRRLLAERANATFNDSIEEPERFDDYYLTFDQLEELREELTGSGRRKRAVFKDPASLWPKVSGIPTERRVHFDFDGSWDLDINSIVKVFKAMKAIEAVSCYRFVDVSAFSDDPCITPPGYIIYTRKSRSKDNPRVCGLSHFGYFSRVMHIYLPEENCLDSDVLVHALLHALGVRHEQRRRDRGNLMYVNRDNVRPDREDAVGLNTERPNVLETFGVAYDFSSLMHYKSTAFAIPGLDTLIARNPDFRNNMNAENWGPTFFDLKILNKKGCLDPRLVRLPGGYISIPCERSRLVGLKPCLNGGYTNYRDCRSCICPWAAAGKLCDRVAPSNSPKCTSAGEILIDEVQPETKCIEVRGPGLRNIRCSWVLRPKPSPIRRAIELWFENFRLGDCSQNFVEVATDLTKRFPWYCNKEGPPRMFHDGQIVVHYRSRIFGSLGIRFKMCWRRPFTEAPN